MNKFFTLLCVLYITVAFAQPPAGYYNTATGSGYTLKTQLFNIIKNHTDRGYDGLWTTYGQADRDLFYENDNTILDVYSEVASGVDPYNFVYQTNQCGSYTAEGNCYNREHVVPQSYFGNQATPMYSDAHFVLPVDGKVNAWRDDHPYGVVAGTSTNPCNTGATNVPCNSQNGSKIGNNLNSGYSAGYSQKVFEPVDEFKGDIARCIFYFVTRYEDRLVDFYTATSSEAKVMFDGTSDHSLSNTFLNILLTWNAQDPVSDRERYRNNAIGANSRQGNRNPFIDNSNYATLIWGAPLANQTFEAINTVAVFPNPTNDNKINVSCAGAIDQIELYNLNGQLVQKIQPEIKNEVYTIDQLSTGFYMMKITAEGKSIIKKVIVQ